MYLLKKWNSHAITISSLGTTLHNKLKDLPVRVDRRLFVLDAVLVEFDLADVDFTTEPGVVGMNNAIRRARLAGGAVARFNIGGNACRMFERLEEGTAATIENLAHATNNGRYFTRLFPIGPRNFAKPTDFGLPTCVAQDHDFEIELGAAADVSADLTSFTGNVNVYAVYHLADQLTLPPFYERREDTVANGENVLGESLVATLGLCNSTSYDAIGAGDFGAITFESGYFSPVDGSDAEVITRAFNQIHARGEIGGIQGEPRDASDDVNHRRVNLASATALAAQVADLQPVLWTAPGQKISKLSVMTTNGAKLSWSGSQGGNGNVRLLGRILKQTPQAMEDMIRAAAQVGVRVAGSPFIPTISKQPYKGPLHAPEGGFMPVAYKLAA